MGQTLGDICAPSQHQESEDVPSHPGASRVPYNRMQKSYASVCKMQRNGEELGTGWLTNLNYIHPGLSVAAGDKDMQVIVCPRTCAPSKAVAADTTAIFDFVDADQNGSTVSLHPEKFYFVKPDGDYAVVAVDKQDPQYREPLKLGTMGSRDMPHGATVTVVAHPRGGPREVSIGHITHVEDNEGVYYNAGSKAAIGSAVFFAHDTDLHIVAMGLKSVGEKGREENMGLPVSILQREVDIMKDPPPQALSPLNTVQSSGMSSVQSGGSPPTLLTNTGSGNVEMSKVLDVQKQQVTLPNGHACTYTGKLKTPTNLPHGEGEAKYDNGVTFQGTWVNGKRHGNGKITREAEGYYSQGECKDDLFIGTWKKYSLKDGSVMEETHYDHSQLDKFMRTLNGLSESFGIKKKEEAAK